MNWRTSASFASGRTTYIRAAARARSNAASNSDFVGGQRPDHGVPSTRRLLK
jgi:hypothetical protein